ncbi:hypothetical protein Tco_0603940 [Tanacetum coccineum]
MYYEVTPQSLYSAAYRILGVLHISTEFAPLLNMKPSIVNPGYVIEVADGKKVEVDRIIRDCKLELGNSLFSINLISLGHGSFDVIVEWSGYYRRFIANFSKIAKPLTSLTQKNQKYVWGVEQEEAFQTLKNNLCDAPILSLPDGVEDFVGKANVVADALSQKERVKPKRVRAMAMTI